MTASTDPPPPPAAASARSKASCPERTIARHHAPADRQRRLRRPRRPRPRDGTRSSRERDVCLVAFAFTREYGFAVPAGITGGLGAMVLSDVLGHGTTPRSRAARASCASPAARRRLGPWPARASRARRTHGRCPGAFLGSWACGPDPGPTGADRLADGRHRGRSDHRRDADGRHAMRRGATGQRQTPPNRRRPGSCRAVFACLGSLAAYG